MIDQPAATRRFERTAGRIALAGVAIGAVSGLLFVLALVDVVGRVGILHLVEHQSLLLSAGPGAAELLRWAYLTDMLGYYLLWVPLIVALEPRVAASLGAQTARLATISGLLYVALGSLGAVLLATLVPDLLTAGAAEPAGASRILVEGVHRGIWQTLDALTAGTWIILTGEAFRRSGHRLLGWVGIGSGGFSILLALGWFIEAPVVVFVGLVFLLPALLWVAGAAVVLLRTDRAPHP